MQPRQWPQRGGLLSAALFPPIDVLNEAQHTLSVKGTQFIFLAFWTPRSLWQLLNMSLQDESSHRQSATERAWLHSRKISLTKRGLGRIRPML